MSNPIIKAQQSKSRPDAIRGECYLCMGGRKSDESTMRTICDRVRDCHITSCSLWTLRPWRSADQRQQDLEQAKLLGEQRRDNQAPDALMNKAYANPTSLATGIKARCWTCVGRDADDSPRRRVRDCEIKDCPIYLVRPWQSLKGRI